MSSVMLVVVLVFLVVVAGYVATSQGVTRSRLESVAAKERIALDRECAPVVAEYLAVTRRWRSLGLVTGLAVGLLLASRRDEVRFDLLTMFAGWFAGAVVAEWRLAGLRVPEPRRGASLTPRTLGSYLGPAARVAVGLTTGALAVLAVLAAAVGRPQDRWEVALWAGLAAVLLGVVHVTAQRVLARPQPAASVSLREADDALRGRSLAVLSGSAVVAAGSPASSLLQLVGAGGSHAEGWSAAALLMLLVAVVVGALVATHSRPARTRRAHAVDAPVSP